MRKQYVITVLIGSLLLGGCTGGGPDSGSKEETVIELIEPKSDRAAVETVQRRNIYQAAMYPAFLIPQTTAYAFEDSVSFQSYGKLPGESVEAGEVLVYADTSVKDEQIAELEEQIADKELEYTEYVSEMSEPPEIERTYLEKERWDMEMRHFIQLYEVDQALRQKKLELYQRQREKLSLKADTAGEVVAVRLTVDNTGRFRKLGEIKEEQKMAAVGDPDRLFLYCDYIKKGTIAAAKDVYATINGKRYEVTYQPMASGEFARLTREGADISSAFLLKAKPGEVSVGDYGIITVISDYREQVTAVPKSALLKDSDGYFVYRLEEGRRVFTRVEKGISDGVYTEILSGLSEGDEIYVEAALEKPGENVHILEKGSYFGSFEETGLLGYPNCTGVKNEIENGTVYFAEYLVNQYDYVREGDPIARIRVEGDPVEEQRRIKRQNRLEQRYQDLEKTLDLSKEENITRLTAEQELLEEARISLEEFQKDKETTELLAPADGIVVSLEELDAEKQLYFGQTIAEIADQDRCYLLVSNAENQLQYGNTVSVSYQDKNGKAQKTQGRVASISGRGVDRELQSEYCIVAVSPEDSVKMAKPPANINGQQAMSRFRIKAKVRMMENVLLVPKSAVLDVSQTTYVYVMEADGSKKLTPFLSGGHDDKNYWVVEGLSEGTKICFK